MMGWYNQGWNGWMIAMMLLWPVIIAVAVWAVAALTRTGAPGGPDETPRQVLDRRLAAGEIDTAHYEQMRALLDNGPMTGPATTGRQ